MAWTCISCYCRFLLCFCFVAFFVLVAISLAVQPSIVVMPTCNKIRRFSLQLFWKVALAGPWNKNMNKRATRSTFCCTCLTCFAGASFYLDSGRVTPRHTTITFVHEILLGMCQDVWFLMETIKRQVKKTKKKKKKWKHTNDTELLHQKECNQYNKNRTIY